MRKQILHILIVLLVASLSSCEFMVDVTTDDSVGTLIYDMNQPVNEIFVREDMDVELVESIDNQLVISGPQAVLDKFIIKNNEGELTLKFDKRSGWKYDKPVVQVRVPSMIKLNLYAHNNIFANDTLRSDTINIYNDGTGDVKLSVNCNHFLAAGTLVGIFYIDGKTDSLTIDNKYSSSFRGADLIAQNITVYAEASNDQVVHPVKSMTCNIGQTGDVYYVHEPKELIVNYFNNKSGRLIYDSSKE